MLLFQNGRAPSSPGTAADAMFFFNLSFLPGESSLSIFEQSNIVISVRGGATVTGVHNLNLSSFCDDIEMNYRAYLSVYQGREVLPWIKIAVNIFIQS